MPATLCKSTDLSGTSSQTQLSRPPGSPPPPRPVSWATQAPCPPSQWARAGLQLCQKDMPKGCQWHREQRQSHWGWPQGPLEGAGGCRILPTRAAASDRAAEHEKSVGTLFSSEKRKFQAHRSASLLSPHCHSAHFVIFQTLHQTTHPQGGTGQAHLPSPSSHPH